MLFTLKSICGLIILVNLCLFVISRSIFRPPKDMYVIVPCIRYGIWRYYLYLD